MNILILGNGAREKVIKEKLLNNHIVFILDTLNFDYIEEFCREKDIDLVIPGTEDYLCGGIKDYLLCRLQILVFGPNQYQAQIEGSKYFSKQLMQNLDIPTAPFIFRGSKSEQYSQIYQDPSIFDNLPVLKYSGLAKGKGVYLPTTLAEISDNLMQLFKFGDDGVIIEKRLFGKEVSIMAFCNGTEAILMPQTQDYKQVYDGNKGPNTGGMGAVCPANILTNEELIIVKKYMDKIVKHLKYKGILYAGLMKTDDGIYFLEFNCRFGDPETQAILNLLETDLGYIIIACLNNETLSIKWSNKSSAVVVLAHEDYPYKKLADPIPVIYGDLDNTVSIYESNIKYEEGKIGKTTTGGRVLSMISVNDNIMIASQDIYNNIYKIEYSGSYYRRDIGCNNSHLTSDNIINKISVAVLASGNGTCLEYLLRDNPETIKLIITNKSSAGIITKAQANKIPFFYIPQKDLTKVHYYEKIVNILRLYNIELVILAGYMKIVPDILFNEFYTINIHPSLLPAYSGHMDMIVHNNVIENNELFSGCTLHRVIGDIDKGRILLQKQYKLMENETPDTLKKNIQELEKQCILEFVKNYQVLKPDNKYSVDIEQGNNFVNDLKKNIEGLEGFCAIYEHKGLQLAAATDGCGTKLELANKYGRLDTIGIDLVAMSINDLLAGGAIPLFFMDYIALDKMDRDKCNTIIKGVLEGCKLSNCKLIGGETAEMRGIYLKNKLDLAGFAIGEVEFKLPKKELMMSGNIIYGIKSSGPHSNGYTLINKLLQNSNRTNSIELVNNLLEPTIIYTDVIKLWKLFPDNILGLAHITGGGFRDNIIRILPPELYFELKEWEFPQIFKWIQKESGMSRSEMLSVFNCGYGMIMICNQELNIDEELGLDLGFKMEVIGRLVER
jgi:phosphoribosylamine--glycine ligase/phosphoribosylaminoimidazole synthetase